tara:strand:- start:2428 stop:2622 length:195 start_codon:yes stop_codon:yes gene_type:complete
MTKDDKTILCSAAERAAIRQVIDLALKNPFSGGLNISKIANYLADKFADPAPPEEDSEVEEVEE